MKFPERLRILRRLQGLTQTALGLATGVTEKQIRRYERAENEPTMSALIALADYFGVSLDYLVGRSDDPTRH